jgi:hypothetical protein
MREWNDFTANKYAYACTYESNFRTCGRLQIKGRPGLALQSCNLLNSQWLRVREFLPNGEWLTCLSKKLGRNNGSLAQELH